MKNPEKKSKVHPAVSQHYRELQKKSRETFNRNLIARAEKLKQSGELKVGNQ